MILIWVIGCNFKSNRATGTYIEVGNLNMSKREGKWIGLYKGEENDTAFIGFYKLGKKDSIWHYFYKNGIVSNIEEFKNGMENGKFESFNEYGNKTVECNYSNGKFYGRQTFYYPNKRINFITYYD